MGHSLSRVSSERHLFQRLMEMFTVKRRISACLTFRYGVLGFVAYSPSIIGGWRCDLTLLLQKSVDNKINANNEIGIN